MPTSRSHRSWRWSDTCPAICCSARASCVTAGMRSRRSPSSSPDFRRCWWACPSRIPSEEGRPLYNTAVLLANGRVEQRFRKALLPTYDVFDEDRYFEPFRGPQILELCGRRLGISICEDVWNDRDFWKRRRYHHDPIEELMHAGARGDRQPVGVAVFGRQVSPARGHAGEPGRADIGVPVVYVNQFGGNDDLVFDGRSCAFNADGAPIARGRSFDADIVVCDVDHGQADRAARGGARGIGDLARPRPRHARLRAQVRLPERGAGAVGRHRLGPDRRDRRRGCRSRSRAGRPDAVALFEPRQHRRFAAARRQPRNRDAHAADRTGDAGHGADAARRVRRTSSAMSRRRTSRRASAATC